MNLQKAFFRIGEIGFLAATSYLLATSAASAVTLRVTIENLSPQNGTLLTPLWFGFHDGNFDIYNRDESLDLFPGTESLVEDGATEQIADRFNNEGFGTIQGTILGLQGANVNPIDIGETASFIVEVDPTLPENRFFSYASMVIPSNDAFIANGNPTAHPIFDDFGNFIGADFIELGEDILDGGTEVNDELPVNTAFFGQTTPNTGVDENGVVVSHPGFNPVGSGGILDAPPFANADFTAENYLVANIFVEQIPEPLTILGSIFVGSGLLLKRRHSIKK
ncbi:spondin domain-containing protein [Gloeocapsa sp. PCC 73106]|uniref:spondin domain-containing protein n=1 Tax=Gloeocapsa sp. PCC 73106 TaxID=102232 RepID=UPI0002AC3495|nr:spondin domain-containing protein [Gloeocapsa sp. PCC 73106]ELR99740.1 PEP-CTERM putative exosortase interaction domain-containing protein [Gloeocapsa sp. PCC 73106]